MENSTEGKTGTFSHLAFLLRIIRPLWRAGLIGTAASLLATVLSALLPLSGKILIDFVIMKKDPSSVERFLGSIGLSSLVPTVLYLFTSVEALILAILVLGAVIAIAGGLQQYFMLRFQQRALFHIQRQLFDRILRFPLSFFKKSQVGYLMSRISEDVSMLQVFFSESIPQVLGRAFYLTASMFILSMLNLKLTIVILCLLPVYFILVRYFSGRLRSVSYQERERYAQVSREIQEVLTGVETVKSHSAEDRELTRLSKGLDRAIRTRMKRFLISTVASHSMRGLQLIITILIMWIGVHEIQRGTMTIGDYVAFSSYAFYISGSVTQLASFHLMLQPVAASASRVRELFDTLPEVDPGIRLTDMKGEILFKDISFSYNGNTRVLDNLNLSIESGETIAIVGSTGAGKTTLVNLLLKFYTPESGGIYIDGHNIKALNTRWLREQIGIVSQDIFLFNDTIENNIRYGRPDASSSEIRDAALRAGIHEEIEGMPLGYETVVGERGVLLSAGQRQRIALARAFLRGSKILILDEPTSSVDTKTEALLKQSLKELCKGRTVILITHRPALCDIAHRVYEMRDGRLIEMI